MKLTSNYSLKKPDGSDVVNVQDFNDNSDKIDLELKNVDSQLKENTQHLSQISNPNLFINGDFIINQREQSIYTLTGISNYTVDRWISYNLTDDITEVVKLDKGIKLLSKSGGSARLRQTFESDMTNRLKEKTVTFSMKVIKDCSMVALTVTKSKNITGFSKGFNNVKAGTILTHTFMITNDYENLGIQFSTNDTNGLEVEWVKLELGSVATPFIPRSYGEELALCQRYYQKIKNMRYRISTFSSTVLSTCIQHSFEMRISPSISLYNVELRTTNGIKQDGFVYNVVAVDKNKFIVDSTKTSHGLNDGTLFATNIVLDAEIY
ncbi:hypothetical protein [Clostridium botulinum]|uniref:hypothetical protein n=1 Tax=Clostridium botulinum TaxID=1491 RepID=UPI000773208B|nr:hypothetical protein [Clostridium botulinum]